MPFPIFDLLEIDQLGLAKVVLSGTADQATLHVWCWRHGILICRHVHRSKARHAQLSLRNVFSCFARFTKCHEYARFPLRLYWRKLVVSHTHTHAHAGAHNFAACTLSFSCFFLTG